MEAAAALGVLATASQDAACTQHLIDFFHQVQPGALVSGNIQGAGWTMTTALCTPSQDMPMLFNRCMAAHWATAWPMLFHMQHLQLASIFSSAAAAPAQIARCTQSLADT